jgi:RNA polymerase sigma factor (sigma-70 family)
LLYPTISAMMGPLPEKKVKTNAPPPAVPCKAQDGPTGATDMATATLQPLIRHIHRLAGAPTADDASDPHLLARFAACRDEAAFTVLVKRHGALVLGVCRRVLGDWHAAEDAFQDVFVLLARKAGSLRQPERLGPWLHGVAHRTALKARARAGRRSACERAAAVSPALEGPDMVEWRDLRRVLDDAVARLPEKHRLPFVLHYLQGEAVDTVAGRLGWPRGTVATRLARARAQLRQGLARQGVTLSAAGLASLGCGTLAAAVPPRLVAEVVRTVAPGVTGAALLQGGLNAMVSMKWKCVIAAVLVAAAACTGAGLLSAGAREERPAPAAARPVVEKGGEKPRRAEDIEEQIYRALREQGCWQAGGGYKVFVKRVEKRQLLDLAIINPLGLMLSRNQQQADTRRWGEGLPVLKTGESREPLRARARAATLRVDVKAGLVLFDLRDVYVESAEGSGHAERRTVPVPLPGPAPAASTHDERRVIEENYRQFQVNLQIVRVDAGGKDLGPHGKGKVIAEPRLMAREGQEALFHCGGEQAVPGLAAGTVEYLPIGLSLRIKAKRTEDGSVRLSASMERVEVEQPSGKGYRLRKTSVECVERIELGEEVKLVEKDGKGQPLYWALIRVVREQTVQSWTESREPAPRKAKPAELPPPARSDPAVKPSPTEADSNKRPGKAAYTIGPPDVLQIESVEGLLNQQVRGPHLVRPDGTIGLGTYGSAYVAGLTIDQARAAIARVVHAGLGAKKTLTEVTGGLSVDVLAYNSKAYYVINDRGGAGQTVKRFSITGSDTVLDALAQIDDLPAPLRCRMWIERPAEKGGPSQVLPVDWVAIAVGGQPATNYQLLPGDRLYIKAPAK